MKFLVFVSMVLVVKTIEAADHLVAWNVGDELEIMLSNKINDKGEWGCEGDYDVLIRNTSDPFTTATFNHYGLYTCTFTGRKRTVVTTVQVQVHDELPLIMLSGSFHRELIDLQHHYLTLSHRFLSSVKYLPNVAKFFKDLMKTSVDTAAQVATYVLAKQVTTSAMDGDMPPDYLEEFFTKGLAPILNFAPMEETENLEDAFTQAFNLEKAAVATLTSIGHRAEQLEDGELEDFVIADLIPPFLKRLKTLSNHINIIRSMTRVDRGLGEYIFDKEFS